MSSFEKESALQARMLQTIQERELAGADTPVLLMVSGGSDSTALALLAAGLRAKGQLGLCAMLHVNHHLRGEDANEDAAFVAELAERLEIPLFVCDIDVARLVDAEHGNVEAVARRERYRAAHDALESLCLHAGVPVAEGRIFTAHTQDDRVENFYMRSIVGTGPGGFRSMRYLNGQVARPLLDTSREALRDFLRGAGQEWREDATNQHTDRFRAYVRHEIVPRAQERNGQLLDTLSRTMNLIADEDDYLQSRSARLVETCVTWVASDCATGCVLEPRFGQAAVVLQRRAVLQVLQRMLDSDARVENASIEKILAAFSSGAPVSGYTANIQGNLAVSANKRGVRVEPMASYRARRKK